MGSRGHSCRDLRSEKTLCCRKVKHNNFGAIRHDLIDKNLDDLIFFSFESELFKFFYAAHYRLLGLVRGKQRATKQAGARYTRQTEEGIWCWVCGF